jgi:hypothetical protein
LDPIEELSARMLALLEQARRIRSRQLGDRDEFRAQRRKKPAAASHALPNRVFWEAVSNQMLSKPLISMVGAQGLEPWTR